MGRKSAVGGIIKLSSGLPWWAGCLLVPSSYALFAHILPHFLTEGYQAGLLPIFNAAGLVVALTCLVGVVIGIFQRAKQKGLFDKQTSVESIRQLTWHQFEELVCEAFRREGYIAQLTEGGADGGVDVVLKRDGVVCRRGRNDTLSIRPMVLTG